METDSLEGDLEIDETAVVEYPEDTSEEGSPNTDGRERRGRGLVRDFDEDMMEENVMLHESDTSFDFAEKEIECQFFGSFFNDRAMKEISMDLIQYPTSVRLAEIRIIPLGASVEMDDGVAQLGSTNPNHFDLEFFYEDLTDPTISTFKQVGNFSYDDKSSIQFICGNNAQMIITEKLLIKGFYNSITLATYGYEIENFTIKELPKTPPLAEEIKVETFTPQIDKYLDENKQIKKIKIELNTEDERSQDLFSPSPTQDKSPFSEAALANSIKTDNEDSFCINVKEEKIENLEESVLVSAVFHKELANVESVKDQIVDGVIKVKSEIISPLLPQDNVLEKVKVESVSSEELIDDDIIAKDSELLIETEDISDGEISDAEVSQLDLEKEISTKSEVVSKIRERENKSDSTTNFDERLNIENERKKDNAADFQAEVLSEEEFEEYFINPEVEEISDEENLDSIMEIDDVDEIEIDPSIEEINISPHYKLPYELNTVKFYSLQHMSLRSYGRPLIDESDPLKPKFFEYVEVYSEENFDVKKLHEWIEAIESILPIISKCLSTLPSLSSEIINSLLFWIKLSFTEAHVTTTELVTFSLRKCKLGLKLVDSLCNYEKSLCDLIGQIKIENSTIQQHIANILVTSQNPTVQFLCMQALDSTISTYSGFRNFKNNDPENKGQSIKEISPFENIISELSEIEIRKRFQPGLTSLLRKINIFQTVILLEPATNDFLDSLQYLLDTIQNVEAYLGYNKSLSFQFYGNCQHNFTGYGPRLNLIRVLKELDFIKSCSKILEVHHSNSYLHLLIVNTFSHILKWEVGIIYLFEDGSGIEAFLDSLKKVESLQIFAQYLTMCNQVIKAVDCLSNIESDMLVEEANKKIESLHEVLALLSHDNGQEAILNILSVENFIVPLINTIKRCHGKAYEKDRVFYLALSGYSAQIINFLVKNTDNSRFLKEKGPELYNLISRMDAENHDNYSYCLLAEILPYLEPTLDSINFTLDGITILNKIIISKLSNIFHSYANSSTVNKVVFVPEVTTALKILNGLLFCTECQEEGAIIELNKPSYLSSQDLMSQMVYVSMCTSEILSSLQTVLTKILQDFKEINNDAQCFFKAKIDTLLLALYPISKIIKKLLTEIIKIRSTEYRDLTCLPLLLKTYTMVHNLPFKKEFSTKIEPIKECIIDTLLAFTIPMMKLAEQSEEQLTQSIWTKMLLELINFTKDSPYNFVPGLKIFSELLPLRLPMSSELLLSEEEESHLLGLRRLWSAFLHGVTSELQEMIGMLCESTTKELISVLREVCLKLADLSASSCLVVTRGLMSVILSSFETDFEEKLKLVIKTSSAEAPLVMSWIDILNEKPNIKCSSRSARLLNFYSSLIKRHGNFKAGLVQTVLSHSKQDEKFIEFIPMLCCAITSSNSDQTSLFHIKAQESVLSMLNSLCNMRINTLCSNDNEIKENIESFQSNFLPPKDLMSIICSSLILFLSNQELKIETSSVLRKVFFLIILICETEYGFHHFRTCLNKNFKMLNEFFEKLNVKSLAREDIFGMMESIEMLGGLIRFLHNLISPNIGTLISRKSVLTANEMRKIVSWPNVKFGEIHPLIQLKNYFEKSVEIIPSSSEESDVEYITENIERLSNIIKILQTKAGDEIRVMSEVTLSPPESLHELYARRKVILNDYEIEEPCDYYELNQDYLVPCDLIALAKESFGDFDLIAEVEKAYNDATSCTNSQLGNSSLSKTRPKNDFIGGELLKGSSVSSGVKQSFGPIRGSPIRGYGRGMAGMRGGFDPFRSRPPNTSRPPSLHVDDFVALESSGQNNSTPINFNKNGLGRGGGNETYGRVRGNLLRGNMRPFGSDRGRGFRQQGPSSSNIFFQNRNDINMSMQIQHQQALRGIRNGRPPMRGFPSPNNMNERWGPNGLEFSGNVGMMQQRNFRMPPFHEPQNRLPIGPPLTNNNQQQRWRYKLNNPNSSNSQFNR